MKNDTISRGVVLNAISESRKHLSASHCRLRVDDVIRIIYTTPAMDAQPVVHAQWRYKVAYAAHVHVTNIIYCTACGKGFHRIEGVDFNFCPNCGARMDGE